MIDFVKLYWSDKKCFEIFTNNANNFPDAYKLSHIHTGELKYPLIADFYTMKIAISEKSAAMKNSIHKLHNYLKYGDDHNYNDYTYSMLVETIDFIAEKVSPTKEAYLTHLEFGLNLQIELPAEEIIRKNLIMHKYQGHSHNRTYYGNGRLKQFDHYNYFLKIYDKAKQFGIKQHTIRIEVKFNRPHEFYALQVFKLSDLKDKRKLRLLFKYLLKRFDELTIVDTIAEQDFLEEKDINKLNRYLNPLFWEEDIKSKSGTTRKRYRDDFLAILAKYNLLKTKTLLRKLLIKKFVYLMNN